MKRTRGLLIFIAMPLFSAMRDLSRGAEPSAVGTPEALCSNDAILLSACRTLAKSVSPMAMLSEQLCGFFAAEPESIDKFMDATFAEGDCHALCHTTLEYVTEVMGWPLPVRRDRYCVEWVGESKVTGSTCREWVDLSTDSFEEAAGKLHIADNESVRSVEGTEDVCEEANSMGGGQEHGLDALPLQYTIDELAIRVANIFDVFPSDPALHGKHGASLLELPPDFGPYVRSDRRPTYFGVMEQSYSWVQLALEQFPGHMVKAFFGANDATSVQRVRRVLAGMAKTLDNVMIKVGSSENCNDPTTGKPDGTKAFVLVGREPCTRKFLSSEMVGARYVINVCEIYWRENLITTPMSKFGTLIHEAAHHHGPTDMKFKGSIPYGPAQCLRLGSESSEAAMNNADNFMSFVYYVNKCSGKPRKGVSHGSPCEFEIAPGPTSLLASVTCTAAAEVGTMKIVDGDGNYLQTHLNLGSLRPKRVAFDVPLHPVGTFLKFFFEYDCAMWEAVGQWQGTRGGPFVAQQILDMSAGGSQSDDVVFPTPQRPRPVQPQPVVVVNPRLACAQCTNGPACIIGARCWHKADNYKVFPKEKCEGQLNGVWCD